MPKQTGRLSHDVLNAALEGLEAQKQKIDEQIQQVRSLLGAGGARRGRPPKSEARAAATPGKKTARKRKLSAAGKKRIIEATKKRWEAYRAAKQNQ